MRACVRATVRDLILLLGLHHWPALVFALTIASHHHDRAGADAATSLLTALRRHSPELVTLAQLVSRELIRAAVLWSEMWFEGLEEASKLYTEGGMDGMLAALRPLHDQLSVSRADASAAEAEFLDAHGKDLRDAAEWRRKFTRTRDKKDLQTAWDHYYHIYRAISKNIQQLSVLELKDSSAALLAAPGLKLVVPGDGEFERENIC